MSQTPLTEMDRLKEFSRRVIRQMWEGFDIDGGDVQDWAKELGLIESRIAVSADESNWSDICAGDEIFEFTPTLRDNP